MSVNGTETGSESDCIVAENPPKGGIVVFATTVAGSKEFR